MFRPWSATASSTYPVNCRWRRTARINLIFHSRDQVIAALSNLKAILHEAGVGQKGLVRTTAYVVGVENWPALNEVYVEFFGQERPARTVVPVPELHYGYLVEIDAIAHLDRHEAS